MRERLLALGHPRVEILDVRGWEWLAPTLLGTSFAFYLDKMDAAARDLLLGPTRLSIVGHSAGGWLARIWLGEARYAGRTYQGLALARGKREDGGVTLLTLGTPHLSLEEYPFGRVEERREGEGEMSQAARASSLRFANEFCSAAALQSADLCEIICVAGQMDGGGETWGARASYRATCGKEDARGDGICPVESAILPGCARSLVLDQVSHSPGKDKTWYGADPVVDRWDKMLP